MPQLSNLKKCPYIVPLENKIYVTVNIVFIHNQKWKYQTMMY